MERRAGRHPLGRGLLGSSRAGSPPTRRGCCAAAGRGRTAPARCPAPRSSSCSPARTSACASGPSGGCCTRPPPGRPRCSASTWRTWTCPTAAPGSAARAARSTSSSGRPAPPGCCPGCSRAASPARCSSPSGRRGCSCPPPTSTRHGHARLSYQQAEALFSEASGGATLHQLRHSALTHDAEDGTGTPMLMARSGHTSVAVAGQVRPGVRRGAGAAPGRARPARRRQRG